MQHLQPIEPLAHSPDGAARRLSISVRAIYSLLACGELRSAKIGKRRLITDDELKAFLKRKLNEQGGSKPTKGLKD